MLLLITYISNIRLDDYIPAVVYNSYYATKGIAKEHILDVNGADMLLV